MAFSKLFKKKSSKDKFAKTKKNSSNDGSMKVRRDSTKIKMAKTKTNTTSTKPKKMVSFLSLPSELRQQILRPELNAYVPLEITYRRRGETLGFIDKLAGVYKRAIPDCVKDVDYVVQKANEAVEELLEDPNYYC